MNLELKHLAGYLPYGLKVSHTNWNEILTMDYCGDNSESLSILDVEEYAKPILHPLLDLSNEIEINGNNFVPIVELAKIGTSEKKCYITNSNFGSCYVDAINDKKGFFFYQNSGYFFWQVGKNAEPRIVENQLELFNKLFEWHFDIYGLIENGLAININTLK